MNDTPYQLFVQRGPEPGKVYPLSSVSITIGRDPMVEITIIDPEVSRQHVRLIETSNGYKIQDLGSTNGTYVDGVRLGGESVELSVGQIITMGEGVALRFQSASLEQDDMATMLDGRFSGADFEVGEDLQSPIEPSEQFSAEAEDAALSSFPISQSEPLQEEPLAGDSDDSFVDEMPLVESEGAISKPEQADPYQQANNQQEDWELNSDSFQEAGEPVIIPHKGESTRDEHAEVEKRSRRTPAMIVSIFLLIICCCCSFILFVYYYGGDWVLRQMGILP